MNISNWFSPQTESELQTILAQKSATDCFIGGGTDLLIACKNGKEVTGLIDLTQLALLKQFKLEQDAVFIGGALTYDEIYKNETIRKFLPALAKAASMVGSQQIRNRGTIAGGVANASPASDIIPVLTCLQAVVKIMDHKGKILDIPMAEFILGAGQTKLAVNQCILGFQIPIATNLCTVYEKLGSRSQVTIAQITATAAVCTEQHKITSLHLVIGSIGTKPVQLPEATSMFIGKEIDTFMEKDVLACAEVFTQYIQKNVAAMFDRDYKMIAVRGVLLDLFAELKSVLSA